MVEYIDDGTDNDRSKMTMRNREKSEPQLDLFVRPLLQRQTITLLPKHIQVADQHNNSQANEKLSWPVSNLSKHMSFNVRHIVNQHTDTVSGSLGGGRPENAYQPERQFRDALTHDESYI